MNYNYLYFIYSLGHKHMIFLFFFSFDMYIFNIMYNIKYYERTQGGNIDGHISEIYNSFLHYLAHNLHKTIYIYFQNIL